MTLNEYLGTLRRHWVLIAVLAMLGGGLAYAYSQFLPEEYRSEASVMVIPVRGDNTSELVQGTNYVQSLVQTYTLLATSPRVLDRVIDDLDLDETAHRLSLRVSAEAPLNTVVIKLGATDATPQGAQATANAMAEQLTTAVAELSPEGADERPAVRVETIAPARFPTVPSAPNTRLNVLLGIVAGAVLGVAIALLRRKLATRLTSVEEIAEVTEVPVLGEVSSTDDRRGVTAQMRSNPGGRVAESLRHVAAGLQFVDIDRARRVLLVTSGSPSEGKTSLSLGLALTLSEIGHRVLFIEADLRRPTAARHTGLEASVGLTNVILGSSTLAQAIQTWGTENLDVLTSGALPPNPGQVLASGQLRGAIEEARTHYDYVVIDTAPVLSVSDALWLAPATDGVLFVTRAGRTRRAELHRSLETLAAARTPVIGIVLNEVRSSGGNAYYDDSTTRRSSRSRTRSARRQPAGAGA